MELVVREVYAQIRPSKIRHLLSEFWDLSDTEMYQYLSNFNKKGQMLTFYCSNEYSISAATGDRKFLVYWEDSDYGDGPYTWLEYKLTNGKNLYSESGDGFLDSDDIVKLMRELLTKQRI